VDESNYEISCYTLYRGILESEKFILKIHKKDFSMCYMVLINCT